MEWTFLLVLVEYLCIYVSNIILAWIHNEIFYIENRMG